MSSPLSSKDTLNILILTATFPPRGGSGIQRVYYQAEFLSKLGNNVWVVSEDSSQAWVQDNTFDLRFLEAERVRRTNDGHNARRRLATRIGKWFSPCRPYPDQHVHWQQSAYEEASEIVIDNSIDTVLVSLGSPSALEVTYRLKQKHPDLKVFIDVRDLWVGNPVRFMGRGRWQPLRDLKDQKNERRWFSVAEGIVNVSQHHSRVLQHRYPDIPAERFHVIQNGYDEHKFSTAVPERTNDSGLLIRYVGFLLPEQKPEIFFNALRTVIDADTEHGDEICCEFYGGNPKYIRQEAQKAGVEDHVKTYGYVDHKRAISLMMGADVLLLYWTNDPGCMCGKFYEYLRSGSYILAFDQNNIDARKVLESSGRGEWLSVHDKEAHVAKLQELLEIRRAGMSIQSAALPDISEYCRENQAEHLATILAATTPTNPQSKNVPTTE